MKTMRVADSDPDFTNMLDSSIGTKGFRYCYACGTCTAGCPVHRAHADYDPRRIVRMLVFGFKEELLKGEMIWLCADCYTCQENCPMGVKITDTINHLKNLATREGHAPLGVTTQKKLLKDQGKIYPIDEFDNKKRAKAGLPPLPATDEEARILLKE